MSRHTKGVAEFHALWRSWAERKRASEEQCECAPNQWEQPTPLFRAWCDFARDAGEQAGSQKDFKAALERRGIISGKSNGLRIYRGVSLRSAAIRDG